MAHQESQHQHCTDEYPQCSEHDHEESEWLKIERLYQNKSTEQETVIEWLTEHVNDYLITDNSNARFSIVSFGCGDGVKDLMALHAIVHSLEPAMKVSYRAVDPDDKAMERFENSVKESTKGSLKKVDFEFISQTYENYVEKKLGESGQRETDLILFVDSLCHITLNPEDVLVHCYEHELSSNGAIVILLWNCNDFWFKIRELFSNGNVVRESHEGNDYLTVQDAKEVADKYGWRCKMHAPKYTLDVSDCFKPESEHGLMMMKCLTLFSNIQEKVAGANDVQLLEFLEKEAKLNGVSRLLEGELGILVIYK